MFPRARKPDGEIESAGGAYVRRRFTFGGREVVNGDLLTADEVASIPINNLRSLLNLNLIELYPEPPKSSAAIVELRKALAEKDAEIERLRADRPALVGSGDCFLMPAESGKGFHIIQGHQVTDEPLSRAQAAIKMKELTQ